MKKTLLELKETTKVEILEVKEQTAVKGGIVVDDLIDGI